jgi:hypothetical protein
MQYAVVDLSYSYEYSSPLQANWHPLSDIIVIGKYPEVPKGTRAPPRPIQFFDDDNGSLIHELFPPKNDIVSLNYFNPNGEILASGQGNNNTTLIGSLVVDM